MTDETLSTELPYATLEKNLADNPTPVAIWDVPEATAIRIAQGHAAIMEVDAAGGGNVARSAQFGLAYREPNDSLDAWTVISAFSIAPFNTLSLKDQQSGENAQRRRIRFDPERVPDGALVLEDADELALVANAPEQIDETSLFFNYAMQVRNR